MVPIRRPSCHEKNREFSDDRTVKGPSEIKIVFQHTTVETENLARSFQVVICLDLVIPNTLNFCHYDRKQLRIGAIAPHFLVCGPAPPQQQQQPPLSRGITYSRSNRPSTRSLSRQHLYCFPAFFLFTLSLKRWRTLLS